MAVTIRYETHSLTVDNATGHATGWLPGQLSAQGRELARAIGPRGLADGATAVFVSDLARAVETAELAFGDSGLPIIRDARLRECNYGAQNGMPVAQLAASRARHIDTPYPEGQSYRDVVAATRGFLRDLAADYDGRHRPLREQVGARHLLHGVPLADLVDAPFGWREGWHYTVPSGWAG